MIGYAQDEALALRPTKPPYFMRFVGCDSSQAHNTTINTDRNQLITVITDGMTVIATESGYRLRASQKSIIRRDRRCQHLPHSCFV